MMSLAQAVHRACLAVIVLTTASCLDLKKTYPEKRSFVLDLGARRQDAPSNGAMVLKLHKFRVSPLFAGRAMVYRVGDLQYESDFYDEWFVAPSLLVTQQAENWLTALGDVQVIISGTNHVEPTHILEATVTEFYGDFRAAPLAVFGLELQILDAASDHHPFLRRSYHEEVPLTDRSSEALALGLTDALRTVLGHVAKDLATVRAAEQGLGR